jgi:cell division protein FtsA
MTKEFIVAIELGSSKITGIAGRKNDDGSVSIIATAKEDSASIIRKGMVYNIDKTVLAVKNVVKKLETTTKMHIVQAYVGVGGQSMHSVRNTSVLELPADTIVDQSMIDKLMDNNRAMVYPDMEILDAVPQEFKVDQQMQLEPVGIQCRRLESNFLNILWNKTYYRNLNKCLESAGIKVADLFLSPLALSASTLTETERRAGCVLVDMGAETTTVIVYYKDILRHLAVLPLGSKNITKDIASSQKMDEVEADKLKVRHAAAYTEPGKISDSTLPIDNDRRISIADLTDIVEARVQEIIQNVWYQVPDEYKDKLIGGIVLTGGMANMKNIDEAFTKITKVQKIRIARFVNLDVKTSQSDDDTHTCMLNTVIGLLAKGDRNCAGLQINDSLFDEADPAVTADMHTEPRNINEMAGSGVVISDSEKKAAEEEAQRKLEEEEAQRREEEAKRREEEKKRREEERRKQRENNFLHRAGRGLKSFLNSMVSGEGDE